MWPILLTSQKGKIGLSHGHLQQEQAKSLLFIGPQFQLVLSPVSLAADPGQGLTALEMAALALCFCPTVTEGDLKLQCLESPDEPETARSTGQWDQWSSS